MKPQSNKNIIAIVVTTLAINATIGLCVLGYCLVFKVQPDQVLLTAFVAMVNYLLGVISGVLTKTSPTEATKSDRQPTTNGGTPTEVQVVNQPSEPVPTVEAQK